MLPAEEVAKYRAPQSRAPRARRHPCRLVREPEEQLDHRPLQRTLQLRRVAAAVSDSGGRRQQAQAAAAPAHHHLGDLTAPKPKKLPNVQPDLRRHRQGIRVFFDICGTLAGVDPRSFRTPRSIAPFIGPVSSGLVLRGERRRRLQSQQKQQQQQ